MRESAAAFLPSSISHGLRRATLLGAVLASGTWLAGCSDPVEAQGGPPPAPPVSVAPAVEKPIADREEFTGRLQALETVDIRARVGGTIEQVHFRDGTVVKKGQLLFTIDARPYRAEVARAESQLAAARSRAGLAKAELARAQKLLDDQAVSRQEFDQLGSSARTSNADIQAADAALRVARLNLDYTFVRSPIAGRASLANITAGNLVGAENVLTTVVATHRVYAYFDGSEQTFLRLREGNGEALQVKMGLANEAGFPHAGTIDFIDNRLNPQTGAIRMRAVFDNADGRFTPGLFAKLQVSQVKTRPAVLTPERAIGTDQSKRFVLVVGADNTAEFREVQLGALIDGMRVITGGLKPGELVVVNGLQRVRPGAPIAPEKLELDARGMPIEKPPAPPPAGSPATLDAGATT
ncbi:efflux RND transporter periplasmic adaptor subunit [Methylibium sp.]|uniref:efflux RND transporter periplasmic adaptor subunit n=1 Tax=Methylibium sp. TaxID=2067992 RepID=UPI00181BD1D0|nr:efflux RND transporter periplasmic adaptor subunit [Methylibium sp.]MBA3590695.1 efflux RND transporter periplasmic adaptor subunit [Methylibium sp.]